jgi:hypothetical protein
MIEFIFFSIFSILFFALVFKNVQLRIKLSSTTVELLKSYLDRTIMEERLSEIKELESKKDPSSEAFLKFVSDSRDWAYQYIDEVQSSLDKFITDVEPEILYFDTYGDLMSAEPNYNSMKKISASVKELKRLLP